MLHALFDLVPAETGPQQDGDEDRCRGEEDWVAGDEVAESSKRCSQPPVQDLSQHPSAEAAQEGEAHTMESEALPEPRQNHWGAQAVWELPLWAEMDQEGQLCHPLSLSTAGC